MSSIRLGGTVPGFFNHSDKSGKQYSLSDTDIKAIAPECKIITYNQIHKMNSIDDLFEGSDCIALLYHVEGLTSGHWVCLVRDIPARKISYFDSYGEIPDEVLDHVSRKVRQVCHQNRAYLSELILDSAYICDYNEKQLQKLSPGVNTCGRFVAARMLNKDKSNKQFSAMFGADPDAEVIEYTNPLMPI